MKKLLIGLLFFSGCRILEQPIVYIKEGDKYLVYLQCFRDIEPCQERAKALNFELKPGSKLSFTCEMWSGNK